MLDFSRLKTPPHDGDVLVLPSPRDCARAVANNSKLLDSTDRRLLDSSLREIRRATRQSIAGDADRPIIALGHQPEYIHPGVWAKHVVAMRLARALGGSAINLVVDSAVLQESGLSVPSIKDGHIESNCVWLVRQPLAYELLARFSMSEVEEFEAAVRSLMADRFLRSQMPLFFESLRHVADQGNWPGQMVHARRTIERGLGVEVQDQFVSEVRWYPLLADVLLHAERFAHTYNAAIRWYRKTFHLRGAQQHFPELAVRDEGIEMPFWAYRDGESHRRVYVQARGTRLSLFVAERRVPMIENDHFQWGALQQEPIVEIDRHEIQFVANLSKCVEGWSPWRIRPRALTLTMWARMLLADLFIHGIGGAKYDRITDRIIQEYYQVHPPQLACVSATLSLDLPASGLTKDDRAKAMRRVRDAEWNVHRREDGISAPDWERLVTERKAALRDSEELRQARPFDHRARRNAFGRLRRANAGLADLAKSEKAAAVDDLARIHTALGRDKHAKGREFFFGLYDRPKLERLLAALPAEADFRV